MRGRGSRGVPYDCITKRQIIFWLLAIDLGMALLKMNKMHCPCVNSRYREGSREECSAWLPVMTEVEVL